MLLQVRFKWRYFFCLVLHWPTLIRFPIEATSFHLSNLMILVVEIHFITSKCWCCLPVFSWSVHCDWQVGWLTDSWRIDRSNWFIRHELRGQGLVGLPHKLTRRRRKVCIIHRSARAYLGLVQGVHVALRMCVIKATAHPTRTAPVKRRFHMSATQRTTQYAKRKKKSQ